MVVKAGVMAVYSSDNIETGHLIDGDYFGEISLVTDSEFSASEVVAITHCQVSALFHHNRQHTTRTQIGHLLELAAPFHMLTCVLHALLYIPTQFATYNRYYY